jgi:hypothetical protein
VETEIALLLGLAYLRSQQPAEAKKAEPVEEVIEVAKSYTITKAWPGPDGTVNTEGWISTEDRDVEKDIVPPESFDEALPSYMQRGGPLSIEHQMKAWPIGHVQKAALVRNGAIFAEASHPSDPADFEHFPGNGTGVYGRAVINDPDAGAQVLKGNIRGFSWVGAVKAIRLPDGGRRYTKVVAWRESTVTAYPVNQSARMIATS